MVRVDRDGRIDGWSPGAQEVYGYGADEVLGQPLDVLVPPSRRAEVAERLARLAADEELPTFTTLRRRRDGTLVEVDMDVLALHEDGAVSGYLSVVRDARRTGAVEAALHATEEELRARFEQSPVPQSRVDLSGRVLAVNAAMGRLLGRDPARLRGADAVELYAEDERPQVRATLARLASGEVQQASEEHVLLRADGSRLRTVTSVATVRGADGAAVLAAAVQDLTPLDEAERAAQAQARLFDEVLTTMPVVVYTYDLDGRCTSSRGQALRDLGLADGELVGTDLLQAYADVPDFVAGVRATLRGEPATAVVDVGERTYEGHYRPLRDETGAVVGGLGVALDVTSLARAEQEVRANEARLRALLAQASDVVVVMAEDGRLLYVSPAARTLFGYDDRTLFWQRAAGFAHPDDRADLAAVWDRVRSEPGRSDGLECRVRHADGTWRWTEQRFANLLEDPDVRGVVVNLRDITDRRRAEQELRRLAVRDGLTGLANRTLLLDRVAQALQRGRRRGERTGLVLLDVAEMRAHNDRLGHEGGDALLQALAGRLAAAVRATDSVARVGEDEFAVLYEDATSEEDLRARAAALLSVATEPLHLPAGEVAVEMHAGVALSPAVDTGALLAAAERAVVRAGGAHPGVVLDGDLLPVDSQVRRELRTAIREGQLRLHFQPVVRLADGVVVGVESLVRWQHPERGLLLPVDFVPAAEASGLVVELGAWVLRHACAQAALWQAAGRSLSVAVNLSPRQLDVPDFEALTAEVLAETGADPDGLVLEVTESALMDSAAALDTLQAVRRLGVHLSLDDFGTGYSSLTYLKRIPVHALKVDRSFVAGLGVDPDDEAIVASVVSLARSIGKGVVAEGVETAAQLDVLGALGVEHGQGWYWSPALPAADLDRWLDTHVPVPATFRPLGPADVPVVAPGSDEERILQLLSEGASLNTVAAALNAEGRRTRGGTRWHTRSVARVVAALRPVS